MLRTPQPQSPNKPVRQGSLSLTAFEDLTRTFPNAGGVRPTAPAGLQGRRGGGSVLAAQSADPAAWTAVLTVTHEQNTRKFTKH